MGLSLHRRSPPPFAMFDFRLSVFYTVASRMSFTKAAAELHITQPAVTRHIKELERQLNTQLFVRNGPRIALTPAGEILFRYAGKIRGLYRDLEFELSGLQEQQQGGLKIGASTTVAQYVLPELLAGFHARHKGIRIELVTNNTEEISKLLVAGKIDLGIIEGASSSPYLDYRDFRSDEIVLVCRAGHPLAGKSLSLKELPKLDLVFREEGSGTQEYIRNHLKEAGMELSALRIVMRLGSSESIKQYLLHSDSAAFLSRNTIADELKHGQLCIVSLKNFRIIRSFRFILPRGEQSPLIRLFLRFANHSQK